MVDTVNLTLLLISFFVFVSYISFVWVKYGIQNSISQSFYAVDKMFRPLFTFFIWLFIVPLMIAVETPLMFFSGAFIGFVGASPNFYEKMEGNVHNIGAFGGILLALLSMFFDFNQIILPLLLLLFAVGMFLFCKKNRIWWIEIVVFLVVIVNAFINVL